MLWLILSPATGDRKALSCPCPEFTRHTDMEWIYLPVNGDPPGSLTPFSLPRLFRDTVSVSRMISEISTQSWKLIHGEDGQEEVKNTYAGLEEAGLLV